MPWNWQLSAWPDFYFPPECIAEQEKRFLLGVGSCSVFLQKMDQQSRAQFIVDTLNSEGDQSSRIEGEILDREKEVRKPIL